MDGTPEAAGVAPAPQTEATPNTQSEAPAVDMHGFTSEQLADMQKFFQANGGYDKVKSKISNPTPAQSTQPEQPAQQAQPVTQQAAVEDIMTKAKPGEKTWQDIITYGIFEKLSEKKEYAEFSKDIVNGNLIKEMNSFGINPFYSNGVVNSDIVTRFLDMKAQTVAAKQTSVVPESSAAPTVDYIPVGDTITDMNQAMAVLQQDGALRRSGQAGHPSAAIAEEFMRKALNRK